MDPAARIGRWLWPGAIWRVPTEERAVYLTFDDGPTPGVTEVIARLLERYRTPATFFCLGRSAAAHPARVRSLREAGHAVGHHTYGHSDAWRVRWSAFREDLALGKDAVEQALGEPCPLFRPPYGHLPVVQWRYLRENHTTVLWSCHLGDYRSDFSPPKALGHALRQIAPGHIFLLHDNPKAARSVVDFLSLLLPELLARGYRVASLEPLVPE